MLGTDVLVAQALGFFGGIVEHPHAFRAERQVGGGGNLLADHGVPLDLLAYRLYRGMGA